MGLSLVCMNCPENGTDGPHTISVVLNEINHGEGLQQHYFVGDFGGSRDIAASLLILPNLSKTSVLEGGEGESCSRSLAPHLRQIALFIACLPAACLRLNDRLRRRDEQPFPVAEIAA